MNLALEECIRTYEREISRKNTLESKASTILSTNAIVISILIGLMTLIFSDIVNFKYTIVILLDIFSSILVFISIIYSLKVLKIKKRCIPFKIKNPNSLKKCLACDNLQEELYKRYRLLIPRIYYLNENKCKDLNNSLKLLIYGLTVSFLSLILIIFIFIKVI